MTDSRNDMAASAKSTDAGSASRARYGVLGFALVITAISYLDRVCISMAAPFIQKDLALSDAQVGYMFSAFTFAYAAFDIPAGWLADRFGSRLMMTRVVVWWSLLTAATGFAGGFVSLFLAIPPDRRCFFQESFTSRVFVFGGMHPCLQRTPTSPTMKAAAFFSASLTASPPDPRRPRSRKHLDMGR